MNDRFPINPHRINMQDKRDLRAIEVFDTSAVWKEVQHSRHGGQKAYEIPSSSRVDKSYHVTLDDCECEDHVYRGQICAHIRAVRLFVNTINSHIKRAAVGIERQLRKERAEREAREEAERKAAQAPRVSPARQARELTIF
jgi:hypothetical protein